MNKEPFQHQPVLLNEVVEVFDYLKIIKQPIFIDGTIGLAGHASAISYQLTANSQKLTVIGIDKDQEALKITDDNLKKIPGLKYHLIRDRFENIKKILSDLKIEKVDGMLLDLGVSSMQLDEAERGFSFQSDAPLDMRMDQNQLETAADIINNWPERDLLQLLFDYGEEKFSKKIVRSILDTRKTKAIKTTFELAEIVKKSTPNYHQGKKTHPATNIFRALRMAVNNEVGDLEAGINDFVDVLKPGGRLAVISFHSIEDRIVKQTFNKLANPCTCPKQQPVCICGKTPSVKIISKKAIKPSTEEINSNPRARSAQLRIVEKKGTVLF